MRNAQEAYQAQLPSKTEVIMQVGIKVFAGEKYCHKDWEKIVWVTRTQHKKKTAITNGGRIGKRQIGWSKVLRSQPQLASRCMFTLYEDGVYGIRSSSSCEKLGGLLVYSELKFWLVAKSFGLDQKVLDSFEELFVVQISLTIMYPLTKE